MAQTVKLRRSATPSAIPTTGQLELGEVAINTYDGKMYIKKNDGSDSIVEIGAGGGGSTVDRQSYTATAGQTNFTVSSQSGNADVYLNGVKLKQGVDYSVPNNTTVTLSVGAALNDIVDLLGYSTISVSINALDGGFANSVYIATQSVDGGTASG